MKKKRKIIYNGIEYWVDENNLLRGGKKIERIELNDEELKQRAEAFKEMFKTEFGRNSSLAWETTKSVTAHEYYDHHIQIHQDVEEYEECARLLKLKNQTPYSEEKTHKITFTGGKIFK